MNHVRNSTFILRLTHLQQATNKIDITPATCLQSPTQKNVNCDRSQSQECAWTYFWQTVPTYLSAQVAVIALTHIISTCSVVENGMNCAQQGRRKRLPLRQLFAAHWTLAHRCTLTRAFVIMACAATSQVRQLPVRWQMLQLVPATRGSGLELHAKARCQIVVRDCIRHGFTDSKVVPYMALQQSTCMPYRAEA